MRPLNQYQYNDLLIRSNDLYAHTKYELILKHLKGRPRLRVLDVGCGAGELSLLLEQRGHMVLGVDPVSEYIQVANRTARQIGACNCAFYVSTLEDFAPPMLFDVVIATDVVEHIEDDQAAVHKIAALTKPGGMLIITVPAGQWLFGYHDEALGHYRRYSISSLCRVIPHYVHVQQARYFGFSLIPVCLIYSKWLRKPYPVAQTGDAQRNPLVATALRWLLRLDARLPMPFGTSVLLVGVNKKTT